MINKYQQNIDEQLEKISEKKYLVNSDDQNFMVEGVLLSLEEQFNREKSRINNEFTDGNGENFEYLKYTRIRSVIDKLSDAIENYNYYDIIVLKKIIVILDLELGIDIQFNKTFDKMIKDGDLKSSYEELKDEYSFDIIYRNLSHENTRGILK